MTDGKHCLLTECHAAAIARKLYMRDGMGVGLFTIKFGGRVKRRGVVPEKYSKASGAKTASQMHIPL